VREDELGGGVLELVGHFWERKRETVRRIKPLKGT
jgi:hypothetical protein